MEGTHRRWDGLDTLRGLTLLSMIAYHGCWDLVSLGAPWRWYDSYGAYLWQQSICWTFLLLSGFCFHLGRHRLRRGLLSFGGGLLVSAVTVLLMPEDRIFFGVLSLLGSAALLTIPLDGLFRRVPARLGLAGSFGLFLLTRLVPGGALGFGGTVLAYLPARLYRNDLTACLGFPPPGFFSTDYFPLLPWLFLFWTGYFLYRLWPERERPALRLPVVTAMGRHSLLIYLLHQPLLYGVALLWSALARW